MVLNAHFENEYAVDSEALGDKTPTTSRFAITDLDRKLHETNLHFIDTLGLTPGRKGLAFVGSMIGLPKVELPAGYDISDIYQLYLDDRAKFEEYAITDAEIAVRYVREMGYEPYECETEDEARDRAEELIAKKQWPCYFFKSDTTGEKDFEEFYTDKEDLDMERFETVGVIRNQPEFDEDKLDEFMNGIERLRDIGTWTKDDIVKLYFGLLPEFAHKETGKYLDQRM